MALNLGSAAITALRLGDAAVDKLMLGGAQVWPAAVVEPPPIGDGEPWTPADLPGTDWEWFDLSVADSITLSPDQQRIAEVRSQRPGSTRHVGQSNASIQPVFRNSAMYNTVKPQTEHLLLSENPYTNTGASSIAAVFNLTDAIDFSNLTGATANLLTHRSVPIGALDADFSVASWWANERKPWFAGFVNGVDYSTGVEWALMPPPSTSAIFTATHSQPGTASVAIGVGWYNSAPVAGGLCGDLYELVFLGRDLPVEERQKLEGYFAWKGSYAAFTFVAKLPDTHPYKSAPPTK